MNNAEKGLWELSRHRKLIMCESQWYIDARGVCTSSQLSMFRDLILVVWNWPYGNIYTMEVGYISRRVCVCFWENYQLKNKLTTGWDLSPQKLSGKQHIALFSFDQLKWGIESLSCVVWVESIYLNFVQRTLWTSNFLYPVQLLRSPVSFHTVPSAIPLFVVVL